MASKEQKIIDKWFRTLKDHVSSFSEDDSTVISEQKITDNWFRLLKERKAGKPIAIIAGDSQTYKVGGALASLLQKKYSVIWKSGVTWTSGDKTEATLAKLQALPRQQVALVVVFTGGNNIDPGGQTASSVANLIKFIKKKFGNPEVIIGAPPPAMKPKSKGMLQNFLDKKKIVDLAEEWQDYHHMGRDKLNKKPPGTYAKKREGRAAAIMKAAPAAGAKAFDPRQVLPAEFHQLVHGDGIHVAGSVAKAFAQGIAGLVSGKAAAAEKQVAATSTDHRAISGRDLRKANRKAARCIRAGYPAVGVHKASDSPLVSEIVKKIQYALNQQGILGKKGEMDEVDGKFGKKTMEAVMKFQSSKNLSVDGCVGEATSAAMNIPVRFTDIQTAIAGAAPKAPAGEPAPAATSEEASLDEKQFAEKHNFDPNILTAFVKMESGGRGFMPADPKDPDSPKRMLIRFEPHIFVKRHVMSGGNPEDIPYYVAPPKSNEEAESLAAKYNISADKLKVLVGKRRCQSRRDTLTSGSACRYSVWGLLQRKSASKTGFRRSGSGIARLNHREWKGLENALKVNKDAAYKSISMGTGQVMGFNHGKLGYPSAEAMFNALNDPSEKGKEGQKQAKLKFIAKSPKLVGALQKQDWPTIGKLYNGSQAYGKKLEKVYNRMVA